MNTNAEQTSLRERAKRIRGPLIVCLSLILLCVALETFQRVKDFIKWRKHSRTPYSVRFETWRGFPLSDQGGSLVLVHQPHVLYAFKASQRRPEATINAQGFRGGDWINSRPRYCRIIVLGGSATFGQGASGDEKVFVSVLERLLNSSEELQFETLNAGVIGYDSTQELVLTSKHLLDYRPDLIIILDGWNDFYTSIMRPPNARHAFPGSFIHFDDVLSQSTERWLNVLRMSSFFRWLEERARRAFREDRGSQKFIHYSDNLEFYLPRYKTNMERLVRIARSYNSEVLLAPQPELFQRRGTISDREQALRVKFSENKHEGYAEVAREQYPAFVKAAREVATAEGVAFVDTTAAFDDFEGDAFVDFVHLGDEGHEALARYLYPTVRQVLNDAVQNPSCRKGPGND